MNLTLIFQFSIYIYILLSSFIYGLAEGALLPAFITLPIAIFSLQVVDLQRRMQIPQLAADGLGLVAFLFAGAEFFQDNVEARLLAGAHLLIYLTWVVLIQKKTNQQYWRIIALGMLQVAVASVLTQDTYFGMLLIVYVFFALWTLTVYSMYRAEQRFKQAEHEASRTHASTDATGEHQVDEGDRLPADALRVANSAAGTASANWLTVPSAWRGTIQHDPDRRLINSRFVMGTFVSANASILIGTIIFILIPRVWLGQLQGFGDSSSTRGRALTGFSEQVELGSMGQILESSQPVMKVRLNRVDNNQPVDIEEFSERLGYSEPTFRGTVLTIYKDNGWTSREYLNDARPILQGRSSRMIRQSYQLEKIGNGILFSIQPIYSGFISRNEEPIHIHQGTGVLLAPEGTSGDNIDYQTYSIWPDVATRLRPSDEMQFDFLPNMSNASVRQQAENFRRDHLSYPNNLFRLEELTRQIAHGSDVETKPSPTVMADRIETYLRDSGTFSYTLNVSITDPDIDPVEDFIFNRKQGHCQYFASAMALMLRMVGIPTRLVNGFKGGVKNETTGEYEVQQRHAHTWVEVLIEDESANVGGNRFRWVTYDPTPPARDETVKNMNNASWSWRDFTEKIKDLWQNYFVQLSLTRQSRDIYVPLQTAAREWWQGAGGLRGAVSLVARGLMEFLKDPGQWISWKGGGIAFLVMVTSYTFYRLLRKIWQLLRFVMRRGGDVDYSQRIRIEFYERFQTLLSRYGMIRQPSQTQQEFAVEVARQLERRQPRQPLDNLPRAITEAFYRCRFGMLPLSPVEVQTVEQCLTRLETFLALPVDTAASRPERAVRLAK